MPQIGSNSTSTAYTEALSHIEETAETLRTLHDKAEKTADETTLDAINAQRNSCLTNLSSSLTIYLSKSNLTQSDTATSQPMTKVSQASPAMSQPPYHPIAHYPFSLPYNALTEDLPSFNSKHWQWSGFWDEFKRKIDSQPVSPAQKLRILKKCLIGEALETINDLADIDSNYVIATRILTTRYNNALKARLQLECEIASLQPRSHSNKDQLLVLNKLYPLSLEYCRLSGTSGSELLRTVLQKFRGDLQEKVLIKHEDETNPSIDSVLQCIETNLMRALTIEDTICSINDRTPITVQPAQPQECPSNHSLQPTMLRYQPFYPACQPAHHSQSPSDPPYPANPQQYAEIQYSSGPMYQPQPVQSMPPLNRTPKKRRSSEKQEEKCAFCNKHSRSVSCKTFPLNQRLDRCNDLKLCHKCLSSTHNHTHCTATCTNCHGPHHYALCQSNTDFHVT